MVVGRFLIFVIGRYYGWRESLDPNYYSAVGDKQILEVDGILTFPSWLLTAQSTAVFVGIGVLVALFVWLLVDEPKPSGEP